MIRSLLRKIFGSRNDRLLKAMEKQVNLINSLEEQFRGFPDSGLAAKTTEFRQRFTDGETLDQLLPEAFAAAREAGGEGCRGRDVRGPEVMRWWARGSSSLWR